MPHTRVAAAVSAPVLQMRTGGLEESLTLRKDHHASPESGTSTGDVAWPLHKYQCHGRKGWDLF